MSSNNVEMPAVTDEGVELADAPMAQAPVNPLAQAHALLRGRYWLAILLAVVGLIGGAIGGWYILKPTYTSVGLIRIKPSLPRVLYQSDQNSVMPMFDSFVQSQVSLLTNQRTIAFAMNNPDWKALGRGLAPKEVVEFTKSLTATHPPGEMVQVAFDDHDPKAAQIGASAVIDAYQQLYGGNDADSVQSRLNILNEKKSQLMNDQKKALQQVAQLAGTLGPAGLKQVYESKLQQMTTLSDQLEQSKLALAMATGESTTRPANVVPKPPSPEILAIRVPEIGRLTSAKREMERQLAADKAQLGEQHRTVFEDKSRLKSIDDQLQDLIRTYQTILTADPNEPNAAPAMGLPRLKNAAELKREVESVQRLLDSVKKAVDDLGGQYARVQSAQAEADDIKARLDETTRRMEEMSTEMTVGGRISVVSPDFPMEPTKDRRMALASVGGLGMGALGVALVMLLGFMDRRVRHISDVQSGRCNRILGVLPLLPGEHESDPEQAMIAAHGVHQIRMLLEREEGAGKSVIAITSASPGAGKTSLTLALGLSFAASGSRTLMIDCDIIGGGLTAKMKKGSRRRLGHVLRRLGLITTEQLVAALKESRSVHEPIGQTLIRQGIVTEADVAHAVEVQRDTLVGLREALTGDPANECITGAGSQNLFLMPLGSARRQHVSQLSFSAMKRLIDQVSGWFDVVLIDTGPVLGSLEASLVAAASDQVVLLVAKGEQRPLIDRAVQQLNNAGAQLAGIVLNRAGEADIMASGFSSSASRISGQSSQRHLPELRAVHHEHLKLGPIGGAVIALGGANEAETETGESAED